MVWNPNRSWPFAWPEFNPLGADPRIYLTPSPRQVAPYVRQTIQLQPTLPLRGFAPERQPSPLPIAEPGPATPSYAFRSSPLDPFQPPFGLLTADLQLPPAPVSGGLLDPIENETFLRDEEHRSARAKAAPLPDSLRGIPPGPEGGLLGMAVAEFWPDAAAETLAGHASSQARKRRQPSLRASDEPRILPAQWSGAASMSNSDPDPQLEISWKEKSTG
jgi:hypothetical protein